MTVPQYQLVDAGVFDAVRKILIARTGKGLTEDDVRLINAALALDDPAPAVFKPTGTYGQLTLKGVLEIMEHEAVILEMYKDSVGVETWSAGLTAASGINVRQYKDNPSTMQVAVDATVGRLTKKYGPEVLAGFNGRPLTEAQFHAALSFHWNTGAIGRADWVKHWLAGNVDAAYASIMNWKSPPEIIKRRQAERDLFFKGIWIGDGKTTVYGVRKPSYSPNWASARQVDISAEVRKALGV